MNSTSTTATAVAVTASNEPDAARGAAATPWAWLTRDTLGRRLFLLMWLALVASHVAAWLATTTFALGPPPPGAGPTPPGPPPTPTFPSLPPPLPWLASVVDYGVRLLVIALAAWWGSRWLARPVAAMVDAAAALSPALQRGQPAPRLDTTAGSHEVRAAAAVFNGMAQQLHAQFESRSLMVAALSHDLRTPMTRLRMRLETADVAPVLLERSSSDLREMNELIDSVLDVFRGSVPGDAVAPPRFDARALLQSLIDDLAETGAAVRFLEAAPGDAGETGAMIVRADALLLRRVIGNLVANALRYAGAADVTVLGDGVELRLRIDDRGPGIPPEQLQAVLQPFARLEASRNRDTGGAGLGLFIAHEGAQRLGGRLRLANREGGGLRAELMLPRA